MLHSTGHIFTILKEELRHLFDLVARRGCGCPNHGGVEGQAGCGSGQPGLVVGDPAHSRGVETR